MSFISLDPYSSNGTYYLKVKYSIQSTKSTNVIYDIYGNFSSSEYVQKEVFSIIAIEFPANRMQEYIILL